ncbi:hypothetical protein [Spirochaeta isovalerica]|uniref:Uncharacterized protein n=1 Tax=Spirochaeta isovalerica TaxID=150 RepID=A0A841RBR1_9SPIO|nr:hypothetical protein [Spirochaeta isovalerica]MBB6480450.1 hypothetical protein [Spirochaeta isovalerica]
MNRLAPLVLLIFALPLSALEIHLNGIYFGSYNRDSLKDLSYKLPYADEEGVFLNELLPLMDDVRRFRLYSGDYILETGPSEDLRIVTNEDQIYLRGEGIGSLFLPDSIELEGTEREEKPLIVWFDRKDAHMERELSLFARLHHREIEFRVDPGIVSLLEYNTFNDRTLPDLIVFSRDKKNSLSPLLKEGEMKEPVPYKFSRTVYLSGSTYGENQIIAADFADLNIFYPLALHYGLTEPFTVDDPAVSEALTYLRNLYRAEAYKISADYPGDFISGKADRYYGMSSVFSELPGPPIMLDERFPLMPGEIPPPLKVSILMGIPGSTGSTGTAEDLIAYLTGYGVQQRIDPETGYLPVNETVYTLLKDNAAKDTLLLDLERAVELPSDDRSDKLRFVLPKIIRLVINGRLTVEQGLAEIGNYLNKEK